MPLPSGIMPLYKQSHSVLLFRLLIFVLLTHFWQNTNCMLQSDLNLDRSTRRQECYFYYWGPAIAHWIHQHLPFCSNPKLTMYSFIKLYLNCDIEKGRIFLKKRMLTT